MSRAAPLALLLAGCASAYAPLAVVQATYRCEGGVTIPARFDNRLAVVDLTVSYRIVRLSQQRSGPGIWYASDGYELRGKGRDATITLNGAAPLTCSSED